MVEGIEGALVALRAAAPLVLSSLPVQLGSAASGTAPPLLMPARPRLLEEGSSCRYPGRLFMFGITRKQPETCKCRYCILRHGGIQQTVCAHSVLEPELAVQGYPWLFDFLASESNKEEPAGPCCAARARRAGSLCCRASCAALRGWHGFHSQTR